MCHCHSNVTGSSCEKHFCRINGGSSFHVMLHVFIFCSVTGVVIEFRVVTILYVFGFCMLFLCIFLLEHPGLSCNCTWVGRVVRDKSTSLRVLFEDILSDSKSMLILGPPGVWVLRFFLHLLASLHACWAHAAIVFQILFARCRLQMFMLLASVLEFAMLSEFETDIVGAGVPPDVSPSWLQFALFRHCRVLVCTKHNDKAPRNSFYLRLRAWDAA